uniref:NADH-ubiquinone oxidoreductase chain 4L n=1 Tax=Hypselodoris festiva TaxID=1884254 RepID=A0A1B1YY45_9GAST|nr:NADH dehydrogenase subunit 4L [Hypselodoris festiva]ANX10019.1 NADH dehydrogenase subunit 4L [Hypselodoris festiva]
MKASWIGVTVSFFSFSSLNSHILALLISLEALMLSLLVFLFSFSMLFGSSFHIFLILLTFAACEAALGLGLLVSLLRVRGNDYVMSLSTLNF